METINDFKYFSYSTKFALLSFAFGTTLFALFFTLPNKEGILILGLIYVIFIAFFSIIMLLNLIFQLLTIPNERENIVIKILILISNIPIAILYFLLIVNSIESNSPF